MELIRAGASNAGQRLKAWWMRWTLRSLHERGASGTFERLYAVRDPWRMTSERETYRFEETNRIIEQMAGRSGTLLEIGCGEGHQTAHLVRVADRVLGVDVSEIAVARARQAVPGAAFDVADLFSAKRLPGDRPYDLVVACEVVYYLDDIKAAIGVLSALGRRCLVTYFAREMSRLDPYFETLPGVQSCVIAQDGARWKVVWWTP